MNAKNMVLAIVSIVVLSLPLQAGEKVSVRRSLPMGKYLMTIATKTESVIAVAGDRSLVQDDSTHVWLLDVPKSGSKDEKKVLIRLNQVRTEGKEGDKSYQYDSAGGADQSSDWAFVFKPLMETEVCLTLDADDTVIEVTGLDKFWTALGDKAQTSAQKSLATQMKMSMSDKFFEVNFRRMESLMPKSAVAVGDSWKAGVRIDIPMLGEIKARYDCKLAAVEKSDDGGVAVIEATSRYDLLNAKTIQVEGGSLTLGKVDMEEKAVLKVHLKTGLILRDETTRTANIQARAGEGAQEKEVVAKTSVRSLTTFVLADKVPARTSEKSFDIKADVPATGKLPMKIVLRRQWEPQQRAFTVLVPDGWKIEGGLYGVDPAKVGGTLNSVETKCDLAVKRDAAGTVMVRWGPSYNFAEFPPGSTLAGLFPAGRYYNGALVKPLPSLEGYLNEALEYVRPKARDVKIVQRIDLPEVVDILKSLSKGVNDQMAQLGKPPMTFTAGALVWEYIEGGVRYREGAMTAICDWRATANIWSNQFTFHMRAPLEEANDWKPVADIIRQSIKIDPKWLEAYIKSSGARGEQAAETLRYLAKMDQEIYQRRVAANEKIARNNYLMLTGQADYVNPYTKEVERDTSDYQYRWTNANGDRLYTSQQGLNPNEDPRLNQSEWKITPIKP